MRYGYFLAHDGTEHGDAELSAICRARFEAIGVQRAMPFDGVSIWSRDGERPSVRIFVRDWFSEKPRVHMVEERQ